MTQKRGETFPIFHVAQGMPRKVRIHVLYGVFATLFLHILLLNDSVREAYASLKE